MLKSIRNRQDPSRLSTYTKNVSHTDESVSFCSLLFSNSIEVGFGTTNRGVTMAMSGCLGTSIPTKRHLKELISCSAIMEPLP
jgi:hypothetical protein